MAKLKTIITFSIFILAGCASVFPIRGKPDLERKISRLEFQVSVEPYRTQFDGTPISSAKLPEKFVDSVRKVFNTNCEGTCQRVSANVVFSGEHVGEQPSSSLYLAAHLLTLGIIPYTNSNISRITVSIDSPDVRSKKTFVKEIKLRYISSIFLFPLRVFRSPEDSVYINDLNAVVELRDEILKNYGNEN